MKKIMAVGFNQENCLVWCVATANRDANKVCKQLLVSGFELPDKILLVDGLKVVASWALDEDYDEPMADEAIKLECACGNKWMGKYANVYAGELSCPKCVEEGKD